MPAKVTHNDEKDIADYYRAKLHTQDELAVMYGCSRMRIRIALQKFGLVVNNAIATPEERQMLNVLKERNITTTSQLLKALNK